MGVFTLELEFCLAKFELCQDFLLSRFTWVTISESMATNRLRVNRTCNYYSCWGNLLIHLFAFGWNMRQRKLLGVECLWSRVHEMPARNHTNQNNSMIFKVPSLNNSQQASQMRVKFAMENWATFFWNLPIVINKAVLTLTQTIAHFELTLDVLAFRNEC